MSCIRHILLTPTTAILLLTCLPVTGEAQHTTSTMYTFVEIGYSSFDIDGEFDDTVVLESAVEVINVPAVERAGGIGVAFGAVGPKSAFSLFYFRANPKTSSVIEDYDSRFRLLGADLLIMPMRKTGTEIITPLVGGSVSLPSFTIESSATAGVSWQDATYTGLASSLGAGLLVQAGRIGHLTVEYRRRWLRFKNVEATDDKIEIEDGLSATTGFVKIGLSAYLSR